MAFKHRLDLVGGHAGRVRPADQAAHAGAGDDVDGNAMFLQPAQEADMRQSPGAAAPERHGDLGPRRRGLRRQVGGASRDARQQADEADQLPWRNESAHGLHSMRRRADAEGDARELPFPYGKAI